MSSSKYSYLIHYRLAFAFSNLLYLQSFSLSYNAPSFVSKGALQAYHVPPFERVDLAACYRSEGISDDEEVNPLASSQPSISRHQPFPVIANYDLSTQIQMSSAYPLPGTYPDYGFQEDPLLARRFPHFHALLLCPTRSLFRVVGSSSRMDGGIMSLLSPQLS